MVPQHVTEDPFQRAAIRVIDETLFRLGKIALIHNQPLLLVEQPTPRPAPQPVKRPKADRSGPSAADLVQPQPALGRSDNAATRPVAGPSRSNGAPTVAPRPSHTAAAPHSSKRRASLTAPADSSKVMKSKSDATLAPCIVCGQADAHLLKNCPVVLRGPSR